LIRQQNLLLQEWFCLQRSVLIPSLELIRENGVDSHVR
jgi:hypothetical protein